MIEKLKSYVNYEFIILLSILLLGLFINYVFLLLYFAYFVIISLIDIYNVYKIAWNNPNDHHKPLSNNRGFGIILIGFLFGSSIWFYLDSIDYFNSIFQEIIGGFLLCIFIPSLISSFVLVYSIEFIQRYRKNKS